MEIKFDKLLGDVREKDSASSVSGFIPQFSTDPVAPSTETAWVLRSGSGASIADGTPIGLLLALTYTDNTGVAFSYLLKYRTKENTTLSVALT